MKECRRKLLSEQDAVSPVIAVILMVAITVVLAAVLYVMVGNLLPRDGVNTTPKIEITKESTGATSHKLIFATPSADVAWDGLRLNIENLSNGQKATYSSSSSCTAYELLSGDDLGLTIDVTDNAAIGATNLCNQKIGNGDYVELSGLGQGSQYEVVLFHVGTTGTAGQVEFSK